MDIAKSHVETSEWKAQKLLLCDRIATISAQVPLVQTTTHHISAATQLAYRAGWRCSANSSGGSGLAIRSLVVVVTVVGPDLLSVEILLSFTVQALL